MCCAIANPFHTHGQRKWTHILASLMERMNVCELRRRQCKLRKEENYERKRNEQTKQSKKRRRHFSPRGCEFGNAAFGLVSVVSKFLQESLLKKKHVQTKLRVTKEYHALLVFVYFELDTSLTFLL